MSLPPLPLIDGCFFIDNSTLELLQTCPRALEYNKLWQRIQAAQKPSLSFGSAIHSALEYRYKVYRSLAPDSYCEDDQQKVLTDMFDATPPPVDDWRTLNWAVELMRQYNAHYRLEDFNLLRYEKPITCVHCKGEGKVRKADNVETVCLYCQATGKCEMMVELPFVLPLYVRKDIRIMYTGRIDLPVQMSDMLFVMDHKTTSMLGQQFHERAVTLSQQYGYVWAFQQLTKQKVHGFVVNAIRTKEPPQYIYDATKAVPKGQSPEKWWNESFARQRHYVTPAHIDRWMANTVELVEEFFWHYDRGLMPQKTAWCCQFGKCQYYDVCWDVPPQQAMDMLMSSVYTQNKWSPLIEPTDALQ